jgi:2-phosphosulfolactate phosphatase
VIDVALTPAEASEADIAVVIDVLRATSTATQALAAGYESVLCAESIERALALRRPGRVLAGERHAIKPDGFDQGNSPFEAAYLRGRHLVLATTNGSRAAVDAARNCRRVLLACLLNLSAIVDTLIAGPDLDAQRVQLVCAGSHGALALEDVYVAGRIAELLPGPRTEAAEVAVSVVHRWRAPLEALDASANAATLRRLGLTADVTYCAMESQLDAVGEMRAVGDGVVAVCNIGRSATLKRLAVLDSRGTLGA